MSADQERILRNATPEEELTSRLEATWAKQRRAHIAAGTPTIDLVFFGIEGSLTKDGGLADMVCLGAGSPGECFSIVLTERDALVFLDRHFRKYPNLGELFELVRRKPKPLAIVLKVVDGQVCADWHPYTFRGEA